MPDDSPKMCITPAPGHVLIEAYEEDRKYGSIVLPGKSSRVSDEQFGYIRAVGLGEQFKEGGRYEMWLKVGQFVQCAARRAIKVSNPLFRTFMVVRVFDILAVLEYPGYQDVDPAGYSENDGHTWVITKTLMGGGSGLIIKPKLSDKFNEN